jgi:hypothetical protein
MSARRFLRPNEAMRQLLTQTYLGPLRVKSYRPIETHSAARCRLCSEIGHGFAALRNVAMGHYYQSAAQYGGMRSSFASQS